MTRVRSLLATATCGLLLAGCGSESDTEAAEPTPTPTPTPTPAATGAPTPKPTPTPTSVNGEWEDGELLGEPLELPGRQLLYAARHPDVNAVAIGFREGDRIVRTIQALTPQAVPEPDGIDLYGGDVLGDRGPDDRVADGSFLLVGSVPGDVEVSVIGPDGRTKPVTGSSTRTLRGFTVFYVAGEWDDSWDQVQLAPLTLTTSNDRSVAVRERSWTG